MKKAYFEPEMEVVGLSREDMILTSGDCWEDGALCEEEGHCDEGGMCACHGVPGEEA